MSKVNELKEKAYLEACKKQTLLTDGRLHAWKGDNNSGIVMFTGSCSHLNKFRRTFYTHENGGEVEVTNVSEYYESGKDTGTYLGIVTGLAGQLSY